jgi:hypothetical protein
VTSLVIAWIGRSRYSGLRPAVSMGVVVLRAIIRAFDAGKKQAMSNWGELADCSLVILGIIVTVGSVRFFCG